MDRRYTTAILEAKPFWMGCVRVVSAPIWESGDNGGGASAGTYLQFNERIDLSESEPRS